VEEVHESKLQTRNELKYIVNEEKPFTGIAIDTFENGQKSLEIHYEDGILNGKYTVFYENGQIKFEKNYLNNNIYGITKKYFENGIIESENNYDGEGNCYVKEYYSNGVLKSEVNFVKCADNGFLGFKDGVMKEYHSNGNLKSEIEYEPDEVNMSSKIVGTPKYFLIDGVEVLSVEDMLILANKTFPIKLADITKKQKILTYAKETSNSLTLGGELYMQKNKYVDNDLFTESAKKEGSMMVIYELTPTTFCSANISQQETTTQNSYLSLRKYTTYVFYVGEYKLDGFIKITQVNDDDVFAVFAVTFNKNSIYSIIDSDIESETETELRFYYKNNSWELDKTYSDL